MRGIVMDWAINIPELIGGAIFLVTIGRQLGAIATRLEYLGEWHGKATSQLDTLDGRVSHIEGRLGVDK